MKRHNCGCRAGLCKRYVDTWRVVIKGKDRHGFAYNSKERFLSFLFAKGTTLAAAQGTILGYKFYKSHETSVRSVMRPLYDALPDFVGESLHNLKEGALEPVLAYSAQAFSYFGDVLGSGARAAFSDPLVGFLTGSAAATTAVAYIKIHNRRAAYEL